jgi:hypothetical protein
VDRYVKELEGINALTVEHRKEETKNGKLINRSNLYTLRFTPPKVAAPARPPSRTDAARGSRVAAAQNDNQLEREPLNDLFERFWITYDKKVGKKVTKLQWVKHVKDEATANLAILRASQHACGTEKKYRKDPERWIRDHRWEDDEILTPSGAAGTLARLQRRVDQEGL